MQFTLLALSFAPSVLGGVLQITCNANNCARAVTGTRVGKMPEASSRQQDCSSFMLTTVTPPATTITTTVTITAAPGKRDLQERQVTVVPTSVPSYATSACDAPNYSSACSCWGITATTTVAPTPTAYETVYTTVAAPPSGCDGKVCGSYIAVPCPYGPIGSCICGFDPEGKSFCFNDNYCSDEQDCTANADCASDHKCVVDSCCGVGKCVLETPGLCVNPAVPRAIFGQKRDGSAVDCNSGNC